jgi:hypothetical protein
MEYYSSLKFDQVDYLAECEVPKKRNGKSQVDLENQGSDSEKEASNAFTW